MRGCESDAHDGPGRLESEARIEECSAVYVSICAIYVWNRVNGGGVPEFTPGVFHNKFHLSLSFSFCYHPTRGVPDAIYVRRGERERPPIYVT